MAAKKAAKKTVAKKATKKATKKAVKKTAKKTAKKAAKKTVKKAAKKSAKKTASKPVKKSVKKAVKKSTKKAVKKTAKKAGKKSARKPNAAFMRPLQPDEALAAVVGAKPLPRPQIAKKLWEYIKKNNLQDTKDKRTINADAKLAAVFNGKKKVTMFEMTKLANQHVK